MLIQAAAQKWSVGVGECEASQSQVHHKPSGRSVSYGELVKDASGLPVPEDPTLKKESEFRILGTPLPRLDIPDKINGRAKFGIDTFVPDMLYAAIARPPTYGANVLSYDQQAAMKVDGVRQVVKIDHGIAVCADNLDAAWKGRDALEAKWDKGVQPDLDSQAVEKLLADNLDKPGASARNDGDVQAALAQGDKRVQADYFLPYLSHATLEPMNCTAHVRPDRCDIWAPTQSQSGALTTAVETTGLQPDQIHIHTTYLGGGFGRRSQVDYIAEVVQIAKAVENPVKLIWTREEDIQYGSYRPGNSCRIEGAVDGQGRLTAWSHKVVAPMFMVFPGTPPGVDRAAIMGLFDTQYQIPNLSVDYVELDLPIPVTVWRSVGSTHNAFTIESFMDEMANAAAKDPLEFRLQLLKHNPRAHHALELVAEKADWGKNLGRGRARGIASFYSFATHVAQVAEVSVDKNSGRVKVHRVVCALDCGPYVNPDIVTAQVEGSITMGLSALLKEKIEFAGGGVKSTNFSDYHLLRMSETPQIEVHIVKGNEKMGGIGEPGLPPTAPAVANAVFAATGARVRRLPMTPETVLEALRQV
jgi:isoquinoline 1-oxidoreductase beta subunit